MKSITCLLTISLALPLLAKPPDHTGFQTLGREEGLPSDRVLAVLATEEAVYAGTERGLFVDSKTGSRTYTTKDGLPFNVVTSLAMDRETGAIYIGTMGGLARLDAGRIDAFTQLDSGLANDVVYGVAVEDGIVYVATAAGFCRYDSRADSWEIYDTTNTLMHEPWCYAVTASGGRAYVAVWGGGIVVMTDQTRRFREHRDPDGEMEIDLFRDDGLVHDVTSAVAVSGDLLFAGTYFGLSRYDGRRWRSYSQSDSGLAGDFVNFLRTDGEILYVATDQGFSIFDSKVWHTYRKEGDGWVVVTVDEEGGATSCESASGPADTTIFGVDLVKEGPYAGVWFATARGLTRAEISSVPPCREVISSQERGATK